MENIKQDTAKERYEKLKHDRQHYLDRARECSEITIPALIPDETFTTSSDLYTPFQSIGARGVNNLASKLLLLLLPPNSPFFRLSVSGKTKEELESQKELKSEIEKSLASIEREVSGKIEQLAIRTSVFEALKHLIVSGNVLTYLPKNGTMRVYPLTQYVCRRDNSGKILEIIPAKYAELGPHSVTFHIEASNHPVSTCRKLREMGVRAAIAIKPNTPVSYLNGLLEEIDMLLVMTVEPGFGGQKLIAETMPKVAEARALISGSKFEIALQVDGGVTQENIAELAALGADTFVAGSSDFGSADHAQQILELRKSAAAGLNQ